MDNSITSIPYPVVIGDILSFIPNITYSSGEPNGHVRTFHFNPNDPNGFFPYVIYGRFKKDYYRKIWLIFTSMLIVEDPCDSFVPLTGTRYLEFSVTTIAEDKWIKDKKMISQIRGLSFYNTKSLSDKLFESSNFKNLEQLEISGCPNVKGGSKWKKLEKVWKFVFTESSDENHEVLSPLIFKKLPNIEFLELGNCNKIDDTIFKYNLKKLRFLKITKCPEFTGKDWSPKNLSTLKSLKLRDLPNFTEKPFQTEGLFVNLETLVIRSCEKIVGSEWKEMKKLKSLELRSLGSEDHPLHYELIHKVKWIESLFIDEASYKLMNFSKWPKMVNLTTFKTEYQYFTKISMEVQIPDHVDKFPKLPS